MSGTGYQSDAAAMTRAVSAFEDASQQTKSTMNSLESDLTGALASYKGNQATAFWQLHSKLQEKMNEASQQLDVLSNLVNRSFANYTSNDDNVSSTFNTVSNAVDGGPAFTRLTGL